jgi:hypothetical protein
MDIDEKLASLRSRIQTANQEEARNDLIRERALMEETNALNSLKEEFEVDSLEDAKTLKAELEKKFEKTVSALEKALDALGA